MTHGLRVPDNMVKKSAKEYPHEAVLRIHWAQKVQMPLNKGVLGRVPGIEPFVSPHKTQVVFWTLWQTGQPLSNKGIVLFLGAVL